MSMDAGLSKVVWKTGIAYVADLPSPCHLCIAQSAGAVEYTYYTSEER